MSLLVYPSSVNWFASHATSLSSPLPHLDHAVLYAAASKHRLVLLHLPSHTFIDQFPLPAPTPSLSSLPSLTPPPRPPRDRLEAVAWGRFPSTVHHLIVGSDVGAVSVVDVRHRSLVARLPPSPSFLHSLTCLATPPCPPSLSSSPSTEDGQWVVIGDGQGRLLRWAYGRTVLDPSAVASHVTVHPLFSLPITALALSPSSPYDCVAGSSVGELLLVDATTGRMKQRLAGHEQQVTALEWRPPSLSVGKAEAGSTAGQGDGLLAVEAQGGGVVPPSPPSATVVSPSSSFDSSSFSSSSSTSSIDSLLTPPSLAADPQLTADSTPADTAAPSSSPPPDTGARVRRGGSVRRAGKGTGVALDALPLIASASKDRTVRLWNALDGSCLHTLHTTKLSSHSSKRPAAGASRGADGAPDLARVWIALAWSSAHPLGLLFSTPQGDVCCLHLQQSTAARSHVTPFSSAHTRPVFGLLSMPGGGVVTAGMDRQVVQWDEKTGKPGWRAATLGGFVYALQFQPSPVSSAAGGQSGGAVLLAMAMGDQTMGLWSPHHPSNPYQARTLWQGIHSKVFSLAWHPCPLSPASSSSSSPSALHNLLAYGLESGVVAVIDVTRTSPDKGGRAETTAHQGAVYELGWRYVGRVTGDGSGADNRHPQDEEKAEAGDEGGRGGTGRARRVSAALAGGGWRAGTVGAVPPLAAVHCAVDAPVAALPSPASLLTVCPSPWQAGAEDGLCLACGRSVPGRRVLRRQRPPLHGGRERGG